MVVATARDRFTMDRLMIGRIYNRCAGYDPVYGGCATMAFRLSAV